VIPTGSDITEYNISKLYIGQVVTLKSSRHSGQPHQCFQVHPGAPDPPGAKQNALRLCESIVRCYRKHLKLWSSIRDAPRFDLQDTSISALLKLLCRSVEDFETSRDICKALLEIWCHIITAVNHRVS
jgi:hypothetical protein